MVFENFLRGLKLIKIGIDVLRKDKEIFLLPLAASGIVAAMFIVTFGLLVVASLIVPVLFVGLLIVEVIVASFIVMFFKAAVIECARIRLTGGDPKAMDGIRKAWSRKKVILIWALVNMSVGAAIRGLEKRLGNVVGSLLSFTWNVATIFVLPVILYEKNGAWGSVKRSAELLKKGWGEAAISNLGTGILFGLLSLLGIGMIIIGLFSGSIVLMSILILLAVIYFFILGVFQSAINGIIIAALYVSISGKKTPNKNIEKIEKLLRK